MLELEQDKTFKEQTGVPGNAHAKKLAKQQERIAKLKSQFSETFFTVKNGKLLKIVVKPNGAHSSYLGVKAKLDKKNKEAMLASIKGWEKEGAWLNEHEADEKISVVVQRLAAEYDEALSKKRTKF